MAMEDLARFLDELGVNEKAQELLKASGTDLDEEEGLKFLASVARETGYDVADDELVDMFKSRVTRLVKKSDAAADEVLGLSDEELDKVAGGKGHSDCADTYLSDENCAFYDNCKQAVNMYYDSDDPYCDSYSHCRGVNRKPDCKLGRFGLF